MEKSFATLDKEAGSSVNDCLNSTAINEDEIAFVPPKTPHRDDIKISPILRDENRTAFHKRMTQFKNRGDSPLAKPNHKSRNGSLLEISRTSNDLESGYNSQEQYNDAFMDSSLKENCSYKTPKRAQNQSYLRNPFDVRVLENIHTTTLSPNLFEIGPSPKDDKEKPWSIDHMSILCPANITDEDIRMSRSTIDPEFEAKIHQQLNIYWESGVGYVPSPEGPRPFFVGSPAAMSLYSSETISRRQSPASRPVSARRRTITLRNCRTQTDVTIPPSLDVDLKKILGELCTYKEDLPDSPEDEFNVSLNGSLPRRLFSDTSFMDDSFMKEMDPDMPDSVCEDLDRTAESNASQSPVRPSARGLSLDLSPIRGD